MLQEPKNTAPKVKLYRVFLNCFLRKERLISAKFFSNTLTFSDIDLTSKIFIVNFCSHLQRRTSCSYQNKAESIFHVESFYYLAVFSASLSSMCVLLWQP